jgi:hypothetical protein
MTIIPATQEAETRSVMGQGQPEQKVSETASQQINVELFVSSCNSSYAGGIGGGIVVAGQSRQRARSSRKENLKAKRAGVVAQVDKALSSNLGTTQNQTKQTKTKEPLPVLLFSMH